VCRVWLLFVEPQAGGQVAWRMWCVWWIFARMCVGCWLNKRAPVSQASIALVAVECGRKRTLPVHTL
jgi:hypothetical protein